MTAFATEQLNKSRTYAYSDSSIDLTSALNMTGLDYLRALAAGELGTRPSMNSTLGMDPPTDLTLGSAAMEAAPADYLLNPLGTVHGGFAATLLDSVMGLAVHTTLEAGQGVSTAELKVNYTRPILPTSGRLRAEGTLIHRGRQMATAEGRLFGLHDSKLYAHGSITCFIFALRQTAA